MGWYRPLGANGTQPRTAENKRAEADLNVMDGGEAKIHDGPLSASHYRLLI